LQEKSFILGQKSLPRKHLSTILIIFKNHPHFGFRAKIDSKKPSNTRRKPGFEKIRSDTSAPDAQKTPIFPLLSWFLLFRKISFAERRQEGRATRK
jgi:hypothetical protein